MLLFTANALNMDWQNMKADDPFAVVTATNLVVLLLTVWIFSSFRQKTSLEPAKTEQKRALETTKTKQVMKKKGKK